MTKRIVSIILLLSFFLSFSKVNTYADSSTEYYIPVVFDADNSEITNVPVLEKNNYFYCNPEDVCQYLNFECEQVSAGSEHIIKIRTLYEGSYFRRTYYFTEGSKTATCGIVSGQSFSFELSHPVCCDDQGFWIPMGELLTVLNCPFMFSESALFVSEPQMTVYDAYADILNDYTTYAFDYIKEIGITEKGFLKMSAESTLVTVVDGMLTFDEGFAAWKMIFGAFFNDSSGFDKKYAKELIQVMAVHSQDTLKEVTEISNSSFAIAKTILEKTKLEPAGKAIDESFSALLDQVINAQVDFALDKISADDLAKTLDRFKKIKKNKNTINAVNKSLNIIDNAFYAIDFALLYHEFYTRDQLTLDSINSFLNYNYSGERYFPEKGYKAIKKSTKHYQKTMALLMLHRI